jgi:hypothetical protein
VPQASSSKSRAGKRKNQSSKDVSREITEGRKKRKVKRAGNARMDSDEESAVSSASDDSDNIDVVTQSVPRRSGRRKQPLKGVYHDEDGDFEMSPAAAGL